MSLPVAGGSIPLKVQLLSLSGKLPTRSSPFSAGLDLYPSQETVIDAQHRAKVSTQLSNELPVCESISINCFS